MNTVGGEVSADEIEAEVRTMDLELYSRYGRSSTSGAREAMMARMIAELRIRVRRLEAGLLIREG